MTEKLAPEAKRLRNVSSGELADAIGALEGRVELLKAEAIRRELRHRRGRGLPHRPPPPGTAQRTDAAVPDRLDRRFLQASTAEAIRYRDIAVAEHGLCARRIPRKAVPPCRTARRIRSPLRRLCLPFGREAGEGLRKKWGC
jgi:hypothetical protein